MKCPHCQHLFHPQWETNDIGAGPEGRWSSKYQTCVVCGKSIIYLATRNPYGHQSGIFLAFPRVASRLPLPPEVDDVNVVTDFNEASMVLADSAKASAALSRRSLQYILREKAKVKNGTLDSEIQQALDSGLLPSDIAENLDAVRNIGNFASHPIKSSSTGEIVDVEPNEAQWNLEVLEQLADFYYVRPAIARKKREELNAKLAEAGKPPLK